jgi:hypothetical protein
MRIEVLDSLPPGIDALADAAPRATFYHTRPWLDSLADAYPRMRLRCVAAHDGEQLAGYLPFFESARGPFRTAWSLPFGTYGGPVTRGDDTLEERMFDFFLSANRGALTLETGWVDFYNAWPHGTGVIEPAVTQLVDLSAGFDAVWRERFDKPRRRRVRRAEEQGVTVRRAQNQDDVRRFVAVYRERLRDWESGDGHPERLFFDLFRRAGDGRVRLFVAEHDGMVVGGHLNLYHRRDVIAWYGMASHRGDELNAGTLLYARCMRDACDAGFERYNLGASLGKQSLVAYKASLGGVEYHYRIVRNRRAAARVVAALRNVRGGKR